MNVRVFNGMNCYGISNLVIAADASYLFATISVAGELSSKSQ
jgi:hypothetical protein